MDLFKGNQKPERHDRGGGSGRNRGRDSSRIIKEKNYFFIEKKELPYVKLDPLPADNKKYFGKLLLEILTLQDLFIGSGHIESSENNLYDDFSYTNMNQGKKTPTIPGSSLKGTILTKLSLFLSTASTGFFGSRDGASSVYFSDLPITNNPELSPRTIAARFGPRINPDHAAVKLYLKEDEAYSKLSEQEFNDLPAKEKILTIKKGSRFSGTINFKELSEYELLFLIMALGCLKNHRFNFKLGGAKNRAMGLVQVQLKKDESYWSENLEAIIRSKTRPFTELENRLDAAITTLKEKFPLIKSMLKEIQGRYGHE